MSDGDQGTRTAFVISLLSAALVLFGTLFYAFQIGAQKGRYEADSIGYAAYYHQDTQQQIAHCWSKAGGDAALECVNEAIESSHESKRSELELSAQRQMSEWAFWALVVSICSSLVTAIGTYLLYQQIILTRRAVKDTGDATKAMVRQNEIAFEKERGHLKFINCSANIALGRISVYLKFQNIGASVSEIYGVSWSFRDDPLFQDYVEEPAEGIQVKIALDSLGELTLRSETPVVAPTFLIGHVLYKTAGAKGLKTYFSAQISDGAGNYGTNLVTTVSDQFQPNDT
ncbi:hypothetical protein IP81_00975 [Novosphingobium sp. AAP83]|uniref:hypothetical protein n=1 Tax=Novosphingobium sp. AAP83 TaxID=1523425 RepID=UPI0006B8E95C|nr:hypothetical protein [Novosphingobium sp. AAP83]KPF93757.1 hypothetical protein IP81_00975 [Novosphingobium sp. AAP83]